MPTGWRILKTKYARTPFDGDGARVNGGRWTSPGRTAVYTADSAALATLEVLVHLQSSSTLAYYSLVSVTFPDSQITSVPTSALPSNWRSSPAPPELQRLGDRWCDEVQFAVLKVPSVLVSADYNYILNPKHPEFTSFSFGTPAPYQFDSRLKAPGT